MVTDYIDIANQPDQTSSVHEPVAEYAVSRRTYSPSSASKHKDSISDLFSSHLRRWKADTMFLSSTQAIVGHKDLQAIALMGKDVVPNIIEDLKVEPSLLYKALEKIFGLKMLPPQLQQYGNVSLACEDVEQNCKLWIEKLSRY